MVKKMIKFGKGVVKCRFLILILAFLLLIPSAIGYMKTRINYDILSYLPGQIETMKGQDILLDEFGTGAFSFVVVEGMQDKDLQKIADKIEDVPHVKMLSGMVPLWILVFQGKHFRMISTTFSITKTQTAS